MSASPLWTRLGLLIMAALAASASAGAQSPAPTPTPTSTPRGAAAAASAEERIRRLERLVEETRAEIAALKAASAASATAATDAKLAEIERRIDILAQEIEALKIGEAAAQAAAPAAAEGVPAPTPAWTPQTAGQRYGLGLSAAKAYGVQRGVSLGGYGEVLYQNFRKQTQGGEPSHADDQITDLRAVVYLGYKFDDHFVLNTELEYENAVVASDKHGEAEVEFAYIDYMLSRPFNARAGLVLIPMGLINELHEPTAFLGARRTDVEDVIIPSTWRELGWGLYGEAGPFAYRGYMVNGLNAAGYNAAEGIREGRQEGSEALAENWAFTGRLDYVGTPGLLVGASVFTGNSGQGRFTPSGRKVHGTTTVADAHLDWRWRGLWLRALYAHTWISEAELINQLNGFEGDESVGSRQEGWYVQGGYDVLSLVPGARASLTPFVRYEEYDTQKAVPAGYARNPENDRQELTLGLVFKPIDRIAFKADWQQRHNAARTGVNQWNLALGYIF